MTEDWTVSPDAPVAQSMPGSSDTAIVAFSARHLKPWQFHFFSLAQFFPEPAKLLIRDPAEHWYNAGLPGIGDTVEEIADWIKQEVAALGAKRVITVGPSMGGYGAILFGCLIKAERAIGLVPQTLLDRNLRWLVPPAEVELQAPDLKPVMLDAPQTKVDLIVGEDGILDAFHAQRVAAVPSARVLSFPEGRHNLVVELNQKGRLWPMIGELLEGQTPSDCEVKSPLPPDAIELLYEAIVAWARDDWHAAAEAITPVAADYPDWSAPRIALADGLARMSMSDGLPKTAMND